MTETKTCVKCSIPKPLPAFSPCSRSKGGRRTVCRQCRQAQFIASTTPEQRLERSRKYAASESGREARRRGNSKFRQSDKMKAYRKTATYRKYYREKMRRYRRQNAFKSAARNAVRNAKRKGLLVAACRLPCKHCGRQAQHYHHHNGYDLDHHLDVIPLCVSCHLKADAVGQ